MKNILVMDDDAAVRTATTLALRAAGWNVFEAEDGKAGLALAREVRPRVIVCDLRTPKINGYQLCRAVRDERAVFSKTRVVIVSSSGYASDRANAMEAGADAFLTKPVPMQELIALAERFRTETAGAEASAEPTATAGITGTTLRFWGVRGSIPTPGRGTVIYGGNTSCVEIRADGELIVLDAGSGIRELGLHLAAEFRDKPISLTLLISHTHWDHIQGFPFFSPAYNPRNSIRVLAYEGARKSLESTLSSQMESPYFPISMNQMPGNIKIEELRNMRFEIGPVRVETTFTNHPGICAAYRLRTRAGSVSYVPDNELFQRLKSETAVGSAESRDFARARDEKLIEFVRGSEALIIDSQYDRTEYPRYVGWGHSCVDDSVALAVAAGVKRLFLFHHDPGHDDAKITQMTESARELARSLGGDLIVEAAREGLEVRLG